jgi:hypothetical protein
MGFDIGIIGCGVAGTFAALKIADKFKKKKCVVFEISSPPSKRRRQIEGFLGCLPVGNGRIYPNNLLHIKKLMDGRKVMPVYRWVKRYLQEVNPMNLKRDTIPTEGVLDIIGNVGFNINYNDYYQWKPESVHKLSRVISAKILKAKNLSFNFHTVVENIEKENDIFTIFSDRGSCECDKIILCAGRSGWRWVTNLYDQFELPMDDDYATYGVRLEMPANSLKNLNKTHFTLNDDKVLVGPFNWCGSVIPEDHSDLVLSAFRSNEDRWKTDKVNFSLLKSIYYENSGAAQSDRIGKLAFLLYNDRVSRERIKNFVEGNSLLSLLPEYSWLLSEIERVEKFIPNLISR